MIPPTVFGDSNHPTTRACLALVDELAEPGVRLLDVGSGSGVLSIRAALLGARVTAIDSDGAAVVATRDNASSNGVSVAASDTRVEEVSGTFDAVVANLSASTLVEMADALVDRCRPGGRMVVSGVLEGQWAEVSERLGLAVLAVVEDEGWVSALLERAMDGPGDAAVRPAGS